MLETKLISFGLSPRESKVYVSLLKWGEGPASLIARRSGLPRLSAYAALEQLCRRNLATYYRKRSTRIYQLASPEAFLKSYDEQISSIQVQKRRLSEFLPQLKSYRGAEVLDVQSSCLRFINDRVLFQNICISVLKQCKDWYFAHDGSLWSLMVDIQQEVGVVPRCVVPFTEKRKLSKNVYDIKMKFVPNNYFSAPLNLMVMGNVVMVIVEDGLDFCAVQIEDRSIASRFHSLLSLIWKIDFFNV